MPLTVVEGWTSPINLVLSDADGLTDLSGSTVELRIFDNCQNEILESGALNIGFAASGAVVYEPANVDFQRALSPYYVRVEVVDALGKRSWHPSGDADIWTIRAVSA